MDMNECINTYQSYLDWYAPATYRDIDIDSALYNINTENITNDVVRIVRELKQKLMINATLIVNWTMYLCLETSAKTSDEPLT